MRLCYALGKISTRNGTSRAFFLFYFAGNNVSHVRALRRARRQNWDKIRAGARVTLHASGAYHRRDHQRVTTT